MPDLPPKGTKFSETEKVSFIGSKHSHSHAGSAHSDKAIVGQSRLANAVKSVFCSDSRKDPTSGHPIAKVWNKNAIHAGEIALQRFDQLLFAILGPCVKLFEHN